MAIKSDIKAMDSMKLMRSFTNKLNQDNPGDPITRGLNAAIAVDDFGRDAKLTRTQTWNMILQNTPARLPNQERLTQRYNSLQDAWQQYMKVMNKKGDICPGDPDLNFLVNSLAKKTTELDDQAANTFGGKFRDKGRKLCESLYQHRSVFDMFDADDKYVKLVTGSISTLVHAAVNRQEFRKQIQETLDEIYDILAFWEDYRDMIINEKMFSLVVEIYVIIFECLTDVFKAWSSRTRRVFTSLAEGSIEAIFGERRERIEKTQQKLMQEVEMIEARKGAAREVRAEERAKQQADEFKTGIQGVRDRTDDLNRSVQGMRDQQDQMKAQMNTVVESLKPLITLLSGTSNAQQLLQLGNCAQGLLLPMAVDQCLRLMSSNSTDALSTIGSDNFSRSGLSMSHQSGITSSYREAYSLDLSRELSILVQKLDDYRYALSQMMQDITQIEIDSEVNVRLTSWLKDSQSGILWIEGPPDVPIPSQNTTTAMILISPEATASMKYVHWFCGVHYQTHPVQGKILQLETMTLELLTQFLLLIPAQTVASFTDLNAYLPVLKNGTISNEHACLLLRQARALIPANVMIVVDGIQVLEDLEDTTHHLELLRIIGTLATIVDHEYADSDLASNAGSDETEGTLELPHVPHVTKICFTTDGYADSLSLARADHILESVAFYREANDRTCDRTEIFRSDSDV